ncbi:MAG: Lrp/AsnC family transcriptional regulator [Lachnospiraceae bacterium]|nr:Lrp/AsnC family transcriptional regulator [Lachnospiraceae bacterium]
MDKIDYRILGCLKKNARLTASAISDEINLSVSAVIERIKKLEASGVIKGYTIELDQEKLGNNVVALMEVGLEHPDYNDEFIEMIEKNQHVVACFYQTGAYDFVLQIVTDSKEGLEEVYREIKGCKGVSKTETHFVLKTIKDVFCVLPEEKDE